MNTDNAKIILARLSDSERVLDVGGWMKPFPRADYVMDIMPYETRGLLGTVYPGTERFNEERWIIRDFCDRTPWPFPDKFFDFAICSHVLEDIRDPVFVCSELKRVSKAGYIETPSRRIEQTMGIESRSYSGYCHHRWLVESGDNFLTFTMKNARIASNWRLHLPVGASKDLTELERITYLFWSQDFHFEERILITVKDIEDDLERVVLQAGAYTPARYKVWRQGRKARAAIRRALGR